MNEKPPQNNKEIVKRESIKMPDLVSEKKIVLGIGARVKEQFIQKMKEYDRFNKGRIRIREMSCGILESEFAIDFLGTEEEYRAFYQYLRRVEAQAQKNIKSFTDIFKNIETHIKG